MAVTSEDKRVYASVYFKDTKTWAFIAANDSIYTAPLEVLETWNDEIDFCRAVYNKATADKTIKNGYESYLYCVMKAGAHSHNMLASVTMTEGCMEIDVSHHYISNMGINPELTCDQVKKNCIGGLKACHLLNNLDKCVTNSSTASIREYCITKKKLGNKR